MAVHLEVNPLPPFDPKSDPTSVDQRWKTWSKRLETYLLALNITEDLQKCALLLYQAGQAMQEIFETLQDTGDTYKAAKTKLDSYFAPKKNIDYEIFQFRHAAQKPGETVDQFSTRLRKLAATCEFHDSEKEIKSAIILNCLSKRMRRFALQEENLTLDQLLSKACSLEASEQQASGSDFIFQNEPEQNFTEVTFFPNRDASSSFTIILLNDGVSEGDEYFFLRFRFKRANGTFLGAFLYQDSTSTFEQECTIEDNETDEVVCEMDPLPANVSYCGNDRYCQVVNESAVASVAITSHCRGRFERKIIIEVNCQGASTSEVREATEGEDFRFSSFSFEYIPSGNDISMATQTLIVPIINDNKSEPLEQFVCDLLLGAGALVSTVNQRITVNIEDDDSIRVSWRQLNYTFCENETAEVELNASDTFPGVRTIPTISKRIDSVFANRHPSLTNFMSAGVGRSTVEFSGVKYDVATEDLDFPIRQVSFVFNRSDSSMGSFKIIPDGFCERDEIFAVEILRVEGFNVTVVQPNTTFIIIKDIDVAQVGFNVTETFVDSAKVFNYTLLTSAPSSQDIFVDVHCSPINSSVADSSNEIHNRTRFLRGRTNSQPVSFNIGSVLPEDSNCLLCNITGIDGPPCAQLGRNPMKVCVPKTVTIHNKTVIEGDKANITIRLNLPRDEDCNVTVQTVNETAVAPGDYTSDLYTVVIPAGSTTAVLMVQTHLDGMVELPETFTATIVDTCDGVIPGNPSMSYVQILDRDRLQCNFSQPTYSVTEGDSVSITIMTSSAEFSFPFTVTLSYMDGSAVQDVDYTPGTITVDFAPGENSKTFEVPTTEDALVEKCENFQIIKVGTSAQGNVSAGSPDRVTVNIVDDDELTVTFSPDDYEVSEGENATVSLVTNLAYTCDFSVTVVCVNGSASTPEDFAGGEYTATFTASPDGPGRSSVQIPTFTDNVFEALEFFKCMLVIPPMDICMCNVVKGDPDMARVNITDATGADCFFNPDVYLVDEGKNATLRVETSVTVDKNFSCIVTASDDSARSPSDYMSGTRVAIFEVGSTSATVTYSTVQDDVREGLETFRATLTVSGAMQDMGVRVEEPDTAVVDIRDDEELFVMFNQTMYTVTEGDPPGDVLVSVTLISTRECEDEYTVNVIASDGSALEGMDYRGQSFPVRFPPFTTSASFLIPIVSDFIAEPDEVFTLQLEAPQNADGQCRDVRLGTPDRATVEIKNDDRPVISLNVSSECYEERNGTIDIQIIASLNASFEYTVTVSTRDGTAEASTDYIGKSEDLLHLPGELVKTFMIELKDDNCVESEEQFFIDVSLSGDAVDKGVQLSSQSYPVKICDNDAEISFENNFYDTPEGNSTSLTFIVAGDLSEKFEVSLTRKEASTATEADYTLGARGRVVVDIGVREVSTSFMAICDEEDEPTEFVELEITVPTDYQNRVKVVNKTMARVRIQNVCPIIEGEAVNDSVIADPLYTVPMRTYNFTDEFYKFPLCYEVHGKADRYFNLVSDDCTSVNAYYAVAEKICGGNVIKQIGVVAEDNADQCHRIQVDVSEDGECITQIDGTSISSRYNRSNIMVIPGTKYVFIAVPNCQEQPLTMWVRCQKPTIRCPITEPFEQPMIKFVVSRGLERRSEAHGLIGQFWGVPFNITRYTGQLTEHAKNHSTNYYTLRFDAVNAEQRRTFTAKLGKKTWTLNGVPSLPGYKCFYAGNSQGGPSAEALDSGVQDSVIEGEYSDYMTTGLFVTNWNFGRYARAPC